MLRKTALAVALTAAVIAAALTPTIATARGGHGGGHAFHAGVHSVGHAHGGFTAAHFGSVGRFHHVARVHRGFRGVGIYAYYDDYGCWRWFPTRLGYRRVWVC